MELFPDAETHKAEISIKSTVKDDWTGLSWAHSITNRFSLGVSAFAAFYSHKGNSKLNHTIQSSNNAVAYYESFTRFSQKSYGLFIKVGGNYRFDNFTVGINVNLPYLEFYSDGSFAHSEVVAGVSAEDDKFVDNNLKDLEAKKKEPFGISIGAGIPISKGKLHINIDYVTGLKKYDRLVIPDIGTGNGELSPVRFDEERRAVFNFGFGLELSLDENLKGFGGFSTDFSPLTKSANIFDLSADENKEINIGEDFTVYHHDCNGNKMETKAKVKEII